MRAAARATALALVGATLAILWLFLGPGSAQPCRPAPFWDDAAIWVSQSLGAGETDGPGGAPAYCDIPTDFTWIIALTILIVAMSVALYTFTQQIVRAGALIPESDDGTPPEVPGAP
ncbi:MAG: hypothetical protein LH645_11230 [Actinomycetia bacterium]|nr:hypothetical protein [Actinomycetes bacterium]